jgi:hypothetical protein
MFITTCSMLAVVGMIYIKEFKIKDKWTKIPRSFRLLWWLIFATNAAAVIYYIEDIFI